MPGNSWRDKISRSAESLASAAEAKSEAALGQANFAEGAEQNPEALLAGNLDANALAQAAPVAPDLHSLSPNLSALLKKREMLEQKMQQLTGGAPSSPYAVASPSERRAEYRRWESKRDLINHQARNHGRDSINADAAAASSRSDAGVVARTNLSAAASGLTAFDSQVQPIEPIAPLATNISLKGLRAVNLRSRSPADGRTRQKTQAVKKSAPLTLAAKGRDLSDTFAKRDKLRSLDGLRDSDGFISTTQNLGLSPITGGSRDLRGPLDATTRYEARRDRLLNINTGGSGDLYERDERLREKSLAQKKAQRALDLKDDARRAQALLRKKNQKDF